MGKGLDIVIMLMMALFVIALTILRPIGRSKKEKNYFRVSLSKRNETVAVMRFIMENFPDKYIDIKVNFLNKNIHTIYLKKDNMCYEKVVQFLFKHYPDYIKYIDRREDW